MTGAQQLSFIGLGAGAGKGHLFRGDLLARHLTEHAGTRIPRIEAGALAIREWLDALSETKASESSLEAMFISKVLCGVLGYSAHPGAGASLYHKPPTRLTGIKGTPDIALGAFDGEEVTFTAVLELKSPGTKLDLPQPGHNNRTPIEQAFEYGTHILAVRWVLVSDMRTIRLYSVLSDGEYEEFALDACVTAAGTATSEFRRLHLLLHHSYLCEGHDQAEVAKLYSKSADRQLAIRDGFYRAYYDIRADLFEAIREASLHLDATPDRDDLLEATQRLLDRLMFIYYCEHHPQRLIPRGTVQQVVRAARKRPGRSPSKVYEDLKELFREVDEGSPAASGLALAAYNGELFKDHPIIDHIELPDALAERRYEATERGGTSRRVHGVWGLDEYDFWLELTEHLLGHVFEASLSDLGEVGQPCQRSAEDRLAERKRGGVYYTTNVLSDFLCGSALRAILDERAPLTQLPDEEVPALQRRLSELQALRVVDLSCGSGAFLVSAYAEILREFGRVQAATERATGAEPDLFTAPERRDRAALLRDCLHGIDKLPQAVELAKLSLWLRSAQKGEKVPDLSRNLLAGDTLAMSGAFGDVGELSASFDLVVGNPPWGGEIDAAAYAAVVDWLGLEPTPGWDSWELFVLLGLRALKPGGRLALVLPDSLLCPEKARLRRLLCECASLEKVHKLGSDWFGRDVRMDTVVVQARKGAAQPTDSLRCFVLTGDLRRKAILGQVPLSQIEARRSRRVPLRRTLESASFEIEVARTDRDDSIMLAMSARSVDLATICARARGEEMSKAGLLWECPSCLHLTTPGSQRKGGGYRDKLCELCKHQLVDGQVQLVRLVTDAASGGGVPFIDGDDINARYHHVRPAKWLRLDPQRWTGKPAAIYEPPKILLRQAGVGLSAVLDSTGARCPQSVYIYRLQQPYAAAGYAHEFVLAALLSRTMFYFVMKRFAEVDPAKAFAKLTHDRLAELPIPAVDFADGKARSLHDRIVGHVQQLLASHAKLGGPEDLAVEQALRELWGLSPADGAYINGEFHDLPDSQPVRDLFPNGRPLPVVADELGDV